MLARGHLHGGFGQYLVVVTGDWSSAFAVADIFDRRTREKVQRVTFNRFRPMHSGETTVRLYLATQEGCSAPAEVLLQPGAKPVFDRDGTATCEPRGRAP